jgi:hypothetical protein
MMVSEQKSAGSKRLQNPAASFNVPVLAQSLQPFSMA